MKGNSILKFLLACVLAFSGVTVFLTNSAQAKSQSKAEKAYEKVIKNVKSKYGVFKGKKDESYRGKGLMYVKLVDFDNNKTPELYMVYGTSSKPDENGFYEGFTEEIWTYSKGKVKKIHKEKHEELGLVGDLERSIVKVNKEYYLLGICRYHGGISYVPYKFNGKKFVEIINIQENPVDDPFSDYTKYSYATIIGGKSKKISRSKYNSYLKKYNVSKRKIIIDSGSGSKSIHQIKTLLK